MIPGEAERLLQEYRQNQELVQNIGAHYYQIIYPVQLRHHEKMGISTREVSVSKVIKLFFRTRYRTIESLSKIDIFYDVETLKLSNDWKLIEFFFLSIIDKLYNIETFWRFRRFCYQLCYFLTIESLSNFLYIESIYRSIYFCNRETFQRLKAYRIFFFLSIKFITLKFCHLLTRPIEYSL